MAKNKKSKGLGDSIEKLTEATGIKKVVDLVSGGECGGCEGRKEVLNRLFPYKKENKFTPEDVAEWEAFTSVFDGRILTVKNQDLIIRLINKLGYSFKSCRSCSVATWKRHILTINEYLNELEDGKL